MSKTEQKVLALVKEHNLIESGDRILVALSGGPDSVFLLYVLNKFRKKFRITLSAAHLNHSLRGISSDEDEKFCMELCSNLNVQFFSRKINISEFAAAQKKSVEEAGRENRYIFFNEVADLNNYNKIATAHNLSDNSETVLLNLIKGTGLRGISGIPLRRGRIIRPVLNVSKDEILTYLEENNISFRVDQSNESEIYERNFIRHRLLPVIRESLNPSIDTGLFNSSQVFRGELEIINSCLKDLEPAFSFENGTLSISPEIPVKYGEAVTGELLRENIRKYFGKQIEFNDFRKIKDLIKKQPGKRIFLSGNLLAYRDREKIYIVNNTGEMPDSGSVLLNVNDTSYFLGHEIRISERNEASGFASTPFNEIISGDDLDHSFLLRKWKNGDKFIPLGMKNFKKVSDFLTEQKVPSFKRKEQLVLINKDKIVWLPGLRIDNRVRIKKDTKRIFELWMNQKN